MDVDVTTRPVLARAARSVAATWTDYPPTPWWLYPTWSVAAGGTVLVIGNAFDGNARWTYPAILACAGIVAATFSWYRARWGTWPADRHQAPHEIARTFGRYSVGAAVILVLPAAVYPAAGAAPAAVVTAGAAWCGFWVYDRHYRHAAGAARARLDARVEAAGPHRVVPDGLDPVLAEPDRLVAMAVLAASTGTDDRFLRDRLEIWDDELRAHMAALAAAGYVKICTTRRGRRWHTITKEGRRAMAGPMGPIVAILRDHDPAP